MSKVTLLRRRRDKQHSLTHLRPSLRTNAVLMVLAMLVLPQLIVVGWSLMERDIGGKLQWETKASTEEAMKVLTSHRDHPHASIEAELTIIANRWGTRMRVVSEDNHVLFDVDADRGTDLVHQVGTLFFGPDGAPTLREFDESLGPVPKRSEVLKVTSWTPAETPAPEPLPEGSAPHRYPFATPPRVDNHSAAPVSTAFRSDSPSSEEDATGATDSAGPFETGCRTSPAGKLLVCHAARPVTIEGRAYVLYGQESSRRAVRALYDLRYHLARLSIVMLPVALLFSWWMGRRMVRPIDWLRERVLEKARSANPRADIDMRGGDEVRDLAEAFNDLLHALDDKRRANEGFVADLVHEFKNPVAAIRSAAESLRRGGTSTDANRAARIAKILEDSSSRLDALVSQFLELARAEAGMPKEDRAEVDVGKLATGIVHALEASWPNVSFSIDVDIANSKDGPSPPEEVTVIGVASRIDSVIRNLVDNAASFAGDEGTVKVRVQRFDNSVTVEVADSGPGIKAHDLPRVFDRFFTTRAMPVAPAAKRGSGLGLALVKAIVEAHDGEVSASSTPGEGAVFRVVLPAATHGATHPTAAPHAPVATKK